MIIGKRDPGSGNLNDRQLKPTWFGNSSEQRTLIRDTGLHREHKWCQTWIISLANRLKFARIVGLASCSSSCHNTVLGFCILSFSGVIVALRPSPSVLSRVDPAVDEYKQRSSLQGEVEVSRDYGYLDLCLVTYYVALELDCYFLFHS